MIAVLQAIVLLAAVQPIHAQGSTIYSGPFAISGIQTDCNPAGSPFTITGTLTITVEPSIGSLPNGGQLTGGFVWANEIEVGCTTGPGGGNQGSITGSVSASGQLSVTLQGPAADRPCPVTAQGTINGISGYIPDSCFGHVYTAAASGTFGLSNQSAQLSQSDVLTGPLVESVVCGDGSVSSGSGQIQITVQPALGSFGSAGGQVNGTFVITGAGGCPGAVSTVQGTVAGTVSGGGQVNLTFTIPNSSAVKGCSFDGQGTTSAISGTISTACFDQGGSGSFSATAQSSQSGLGTIPSNTFGPGGSTTNPTATFAEPVNTATGNYYTAHTDVSVHGRGLNLVFNRYYNSLDAYSGPLGAGWSHSYNIFLTINSDGSVNLKEASGATLAYTPKGSGAYSAATAGCFDTLSQNADGSFVLTRKNRTKLAFAKTGVLLSVADRNGNAQTLAYSSGGDLTTIADTVGRVFTLSYDANHRLVSLTDPAGRSVSYSYDSNGNLVSFKDAAGGITAYTYDSAHRMTTATDPRGVKYLANTFDAQGRVISQSNAAGNATKFAYAPGSSGSIATITDGNGDTLKQSYDANLRFVQSADGAGSVRGFAYDAHNDQTGLTDPNGNTTTIGYDGSGNATSRTDAAGNVRVFTYDAYNDITSTTDALGHKTAFTYDQSGNLINAKDPLGEVTQYTHDASGQITAITDALGNRSQLSWDSSGNLVQTIDGAGRKITMSYDAVGRPVSRTDGLGHTAKVQYDALDRIVSRTDALGNQTQYTYDAVGHMLTWTDANGNVTSYSYDGVGNLASMTDAGGAKTTYSYDANNNRISVTDARGKTTSYSYDAANRLVKVTDPLGRTRAVSYDAAGNRLAITDGNAKTNHFNYDALNRLTNSAYFDGTAVTYAYDANGNRSSMTDQHGKTNYTYDALNRLTAVMRFDGQNVGYAYDTVGRRASLTYPDGRVLSFQYDPGSKLVAVVDSAGGTTSYSYDAVGNPISTKLPNQVTSSRSYDSANRIASIADSGPAGVLSSFSYVLDPAGNRLEATTADGGVSKYTYDSLNRLTQWTAPSGQANQYSYDAVGNRTSVTSSAGAIVYTYDDAGELLTAGSISFTYDGNGSRLTRSAGQGVTSYAWDARNRLAGITGAAASIQYDYDPDGRRLSQQAGNANYSYSHDILGLGNVIGEQGSDGATDYIYGRALISVAGPDGPAYLSRDGGGNTSSVSNLTGALDGTYEYDPWGKLLNPIDPLGSKAKYKFAGQEFDPAAGVYFMRARYYDPSVGQFLSRDPLGRPQGQPMDQNVYAYARNNPLRFSDPSGLVPEALLEQDLKYWDIAYGGRGLRTRNPGYSSGGLCKYTSILGTGVGPCITGTIQGYWYQDDYGNQLYGQMYVPYPQYGSVNGYWYTDQWGNPQYGYNVWDATDGSTSNYQALPSWDDLYGGGFDDTGYSSDGGGIPGDSSNY